MKRETDWSRAVRALRESLHWTQAELAAALSVNVVVVSGWETARQEPSEARYIQLGRLAGHPDCWFFWERAGLSKSDIMRLLPELGGQPSRPRTAKIPELVLATPVSGRQAKTAAADMDLVACVARAAAGEPISTDILDDSSQRFYAFHREYLRRLDPQGDWVCVKVDKHSGESMMPTIYPEELLLVNRNKSRLLMRPPRPRAINNKVYLVDMGAVSGRESGITVKRLYLDLRAESLALVADNKEFGVIVVPLRDLDLARVIVGQVVWHGGEVK